MSSKTLLPLRIPELGPSFGRLVIGSGREPVGEATGGGLELSGVRHRLVTRLFDHAGEARRLASHDQRAAAIGALSRASWLAAWEEAVAAVAETVWSSGNERLKLEADAVAMPPKLRDLAFPGAGDRRALVARLGSAGAGLVRALDDLERCGAAALQATSLERADMDAWLNALKTAARRLEAAWMDLETRVESELHRFDSAADRVAKWRRPLWPVWVAGGVALIAAVWLGLVMGGYLPAPGFLKPLVAAWPQ